MNRPAIWTLPLLAAVLLTMSGTAGVAGPVADQGARPILADNQGPTLVEP
ncbi:hypothetical protein JL475_34665 [Streptomyces sp. M2CJ-2]|nr:hypothetical protein [Streptomyces sp. M2CJ-2]MBL3670999.1 hypothetical protein [Streptomyces sp. M2CJ-2]